MNEGKEGPKANTKNSNNMNKYDNQPTSIQFNTSQNKNIPIFIIYQASKIIQSQHQNLIYDKMS